MADGLCKLRLEYKDLFNSGYETERTENIFESELNFAQVYCELQSKEHNTKVSALAYDCIMRKCYDFLLTCEHIKSVNPLQPQGMIWFVN